MTAQTDLQSPTSTRRSFLQWLLGFSVTSTVAGIFAPVISYLLPSQRARLDSSDPILVGTVTDFAVGTGKIVSVNDKPVIIVNTTVGGIKAFSAICTHLGCVVAWNGKKNVIQSPCHDGLFNPVTGAVVGGPPPRPLPSYELTVKDGKLYVGQPQGKIYGA